MTHQTGPNQFQFFFEQDHYTELKDYLYSYVLRKNAVNNILKPEKIEMALEIGSGLSPVMRHRNQLVYSDLSFLALKRLKEKSGAGMYVVADGVHLPFESGVFSHVICSEVLEHIPNDGRVISEMARVMAPSGGLIITFPHRNAYYALDDRFVSHLRRYELSQMKQKLKRYQFKPVSIRKVLGPMDKVAICLLILLFMLFQKIQKKGFRGKNNFKPAPWVIVSFRFINYFYCALAWLDARLLPMSMSSVLLVSAVLLKTGADDIDLKNL
ncbi:MAG: class I SAM-dependent methyltransferase [Desulfobacteraceae bacterium]|nr:class I SAM-dependent methyltransferase [Desulfobacteraceae bacterium]